MKKKNKKIDLPDIQDLVRQIVNEVFNTPLPSADLTTFSRPIDLIVTQNPKNVSIDVAIYAFKNGRRIRRISWDPERMLDSNIGFEQFISSQDLLCDDWIIVDNEL